MIKRIFSFLLYLLGPSNKREDAVISPSYQDVGDTPMSKIKKAIQEDKIKKPTKKRVINKEKVILKIKHNIFYLELLAEKLENSTKYKSYYLKVLDLKSQSENMLKIIYRMKPEAPYFYNTMRAIVQHTKTVAKLLEVR